MSKAVLISIQPKWCQLIATREKTLEIRKTMPDLKTPFRRYIYQTKNGKVGTGLFTREGEIMGRSVKNGKVIGEFACDCIYPISYTMGGAYHVYGLSPMPEIKELSQKAQMSLRDMHDYLRANGGYGWNISGLLIYDKPKELSEFRKPCINDLYCESCAMFGGFCDHCGNKALMLSRAPQSWCYVEELKGGGG